MRDYYKVDEELGIPINQTERGELFHPEQKDRAEKVMKALDGLRVCTALAFLRKCEQAVLQSMVEVD